jgi:ketosteroid isomerase-like protein
MDRDKVLAIIDAAYAARRAGDAAALAGVWAEGATYELAGDKSLLAAFPAAGPSASQPAVEAIMAQIAMPGLERLEAVVEWPRAVVLWRASVTVAGRPVVETVLCDVFTFDEAGKIRSLLQFSDTALVVNEMQGAKAS